MHNGRATAKDDGTVPDAVMYFILVGALTTNPSPLLLKVGPLMFSFYF